MQSGEPQADGQSTPEEVQYASITGGTGAMRRVQTNGSARDNQIRRTSTARSRGVRDPDLDINLPYRTLTNEANMEEYTAEVPEGEIPGPPKEGADGEKRYRLVTFEPNDPGNPKNWSKAKKWHCTMTVALTCFIVAFCSSVITPDIDGLAAEFDQSIQLSLASISLFVMGFGIGPMVFAPLSEIYGRRII
jgi:hypothetical protein